MSIEPRSTSPTRSWRLESINEKEKMMHNMFYIVGVVVVVLFVLGYFGLR
jgi:hypothetical protein